MGTWVPGYLAGYLGRLCGPRGEFLILLQLPAALSLCCMQALADPATRTRLRPPGYEAYPILLDPCNLQANVVADSSI